MKAYNAWRPSFEGQGVYDWQRLIHARLILGEIAIESQKALVGRNAEISWAVRFALNQADAARALLDKNPSWNQRVELRIAIAALYHKIRNTFQTEPKTHRKIEENLAELLDPSSLNTVSGDYDWVQFQRDRLAAASAQMGMAFMWGNYIKDLMNRVERSQPVRESRPQYDYYGRPIYAPPTQSPPPLTQVFYLEHMIAAHSLIPDTSGASLAWDELRELAQTNNNPMDNVTEARALSRIALAAAIQKPSEKSKNFPEVLERIQRVKTLLTSGKSKLPKEFQFAGYQLVLALVHMGKSWDAAALLPRIQENDGYADAVRLEMVRFALSVAENKVAQLWIAEMTLTHEHLQAKRLMARSDVRVATGRIEELLVEIRKNPDPLDRTVALAGLVEGLARCPWLKE